MRRKTKKIRKVKNKRKGIFLLIFLIILLLFFYIYNQRIIYESYDSVRPELTLYRQVVRGDGYLLLDEKVTESKGTGIAVYNVQEGEKIPKNYTVMNVNLMQDNSKLKDELIQVQAAIDYKNDESDVDSENLSLSLEEVNIIRNIQRFIRNESYEKLIASINSLDLHTKHSVNISDLNELLMLPLEDLENKKEKLSKSLSTTNNEYNSMDSGIVSYIFDDIDGKLNSQVDFENFTYAYLQSIENKIFENGRRSVKKGEPLFRTINNLEWYMALTVPDKNLFSKNIGDSIRVKLDNNELLNGEIIQYNGDSKGSAVLILRFQDKLSDLYLDRKREVKIIIEEFNTFTIPSSAVIKSEEGVFGVYIQEIHGLVQFIPVEIVGETREEVYISRGNKNNIIMVGNKPYQTLTINDNVIINPEKVEEKQIVD